MLIVERHLLVLLWLTLVGFDLIIVLLLNCSLQSQIAFSSINQCKCQRKEISGRWFSVKVNKCEHLAKKDSDISLNRFDLAGGSCAENVKSARITKSHGVATFANCMKSRISRVVKFPLRDALI